MSLGCPFCTSEYIVPRHHLDNKALFHCMTCGEDFPTPDVSAEPYPNPSDDYDVCAIEGHYWQEVRIFNDTCSECVRCGAIDC
jgi:hypothetical protein